MLTLTNNFIIKEIEEELFGIKLIGQIMID